MNIFPGVRSILLLGHSPLLGVCWAFTTSSPLWLLPVRFYRLLQRQFLTAVAPPESCLDAQLTTKTFEANKTGDLLPDRPTVAWHDAQSSRHRITESETQKFFSNRSEPSVIPAVKPATAIIIGRRVVFKE